MAEWMNQLMKLFDNDAPAPGPAPATAAPGPAPAAGDAAAPSAGPAAGAPAPAAAAPAPAVDIVDYDEEEAGDAVSPLPSPMKAGKVAKPSLNLSTVQPSTGASPSTRRKWSYRLFSSSSPPSGEVSFRAGKKSAIHEICEILHMPPSETSTEEVLQCAEKLGPLVGDFNKIATAAKAGALEAIAAAFGAYHDNTQVLPALFPALINLSAGDDAPGKARACKLVELLMIETLSAVLRMQGVRDYDLCLQALWALQHVMRPGEARHAETSSLVSLYLDRPCVHEMPAVVANVLRYYQPLTMSGRTDVHVKGCNVLLCCLAPLRHAGLSVAPITSVLVELLQALAAAVLAENEGAMAGSGGASDTASAAPDGQLTQSVSTLMCLVTLVLADACTDDASCKVATDLGAAGAVVSAMRALPDHGEMRENGCMLLAHMCAHRDEEALDAACATILQASPLPMMLGGLHLQQRFPRGAARDKERFLAVRKQACAAVAALGAAPAARTALEEHGAIALIIGVLREHRKVLYIVQPALAALEVLCAGADEGGKAKAVQAGAIPLLVNILKKHLKSREAVEAGSGALTAVCYTEQLQKEALKAGAEPQLLTAR